MPIESDHQQQLLKRLVTYVPSHWVRRAFDCPAPPTPSSEWRHGAVVAVELTGLASLAEHAGRLGHDGAVELSRLLNLALGSLLEQALFPLGGCLVRMSGDQLLAFFLGERSLERAAFCGLRMHEVLGRSGPRLAGEPALGLRVGLARGPLYLAQIGDAAERMEVVVAGPALTQALAAQDEARQGEVALAAGPLDAGCGVELGGSRGAISLVVAVRPEPELEPLVDLGGELGKETLAKVNALRPFLPPERFDGLLADPAAPGPAPRLQRASVLLAEFWNVNPVRATARDELNQRFLLVNQIVQRHGGVLTRLDFTGRGRKLTALFGIPDARGNDEERALGCALELREALGSLRMRIAVNTGFLFSGEVGSALRREHAVLGEAVQVAQKLLDGADEGAIVAGPESWRAGGAGLELGPSWVVRLKGSRAPLSARAVLRRSDRIRIAVAPGRLAGRTGELAYGLRCIERMIEDGGGALLVRGVQGTGKTRFLRELVAQAQPRWRIQIRRLRCTYLTRATPFGLVEACIQALTGERRPLAAWLEDVPELVKSQVEALGALPPAGTRAGFTAILHRLAADALTTLSTRPRTLLVIDDLDQADPESLAVLRSLARTRSVAFVGSSAEELGPELPQLELPPLDSAALVELTREQLGEAPPALVQWLEERSEGNALQARALLAWLVETDALEKGPDGAAVRAASLESVPTALTASAYPQPSEESGPHTLITDPGGAPPLLFEDDPADELKRQASHRQLAELIEAVPGAQVERLEELALLYGASDRPAKAVRYARAASARAAERLKLGLALKWAEAAAHAAQSLEDEALIQRVRLEEAIAWQRLYDPHRAATIAREVWQRAEAAGDAELALQAAGVAAASLAEGYAPSAEAACRSALSLAEAAGDEPARAGALLSLVRVLRGRGELAEAGFVLEKATELAARVGSEELPILALIQSGLLRAELGETQRARAALEAAVVLTRPTHLGRLRVFALLNLGVIRASLADFPGAEQVYREAERLAGELELVIPRAAALVNLSDLHREAGDREQARFYAEAARKEAARTGDVRVAAAAQVKRALAAADDEEALALGADALARLQGLDDASLFIESASDLALLALDWGEEKWAVELFTAARARAEVTGIARHARALDRLGDLIHDRRAPPPPGDPHTLVTAPGH